MNEPVNRPALFVGSSSEGLELARGVRQLLAPDAEVTLWNEGLFDLGTTLIDGLIRALPRFDFAVLMLTTDDLSTSHGVTKLGPRDNVLFELGLFMGRLGRERTFVIRPRGDQIKIPSDLAGLTTAMYDWPRSDHDHQAAVGPACDNIRKIILRLGFSQARTSNQIRIFQEEQVRQGADLQRMILFLLQNFVSNYELIHLKKLESGEPFPFKNSDTFEKELRRLLSLGLIARRPNKGIRSLFSAGDDVRNHLEITDRGKWYLENLADLERGEAEA
jgi:hypothetical protein